MAFRVLHIGKFFPPYHGGMEVFLADLIAAQRRLGIEAAALVHGEPQPDDPPWLTRVPTYGSVLYAPVAPGFHAALGRALRTVQPDVLHLHLPNASAWWVLASTAARDIPWVVQWHSDVLTTKGWGLLPMAYRLYRPFEQALLRRAARVIVTSAPYLDASQTLSGWRDKCAVVPLGANLDRLPEVTDQEDVVPWRPSCLRLLSVGRLAHYKGFPTLIRAVAGLCEVELVIVGDGETRSELEALVRELTPAGAAPSVALLGAVDDARKHALLAGCDVFCLASNERTEAFGVAVLEAMHYAKPCIVSDLPGSGMPWLVSQSAAGLLAPPGNVEAWRDAIRAMHDPAVRHAYGRSGQRAARETFGIAACAAAVSCEYARLGTDAPLPEAIGPVPDRGILIVIPARDEAATIGEVIGGLRSAGWKEVAVIDDCSADDTATRAAAAGAEVFRPVLPLGAWGAMQTGIRHALRQGYSGVITMDADGQHEVGEIPSLLARCDTADVVIGAHPERGSRARRIAWRWFRRLTGFGLADLTSGFRYYNAEAMRVAASQEATLLDYQDIGVLLLLRRAGLRIAEVPVEMNPRAVGKSRVFNSWLTVARYMSATTLLCLSQWRVERPNVAGARVRRS